MEEPSTPGEEADAIVEQMTRSVIKKLSGADSDIMGLIQPGEQLADLGAADSRDAPSQQTAAIAAPDVKIHPAEKMDTNDDVNQVYQTDVHQPQTVNNDYTE